MLARCLILLATLPVQAFAGDCPLPIPLDDQVQRDLFRGVLESREIVGQIQEGLSIDPQSGVSSPTFYELIEYGFAVTDDYSGVGDRVVFQDRGDYLPQGPHDNSAVICLGCPEDYVVGESYFVAVEYVDGIPRPMSCHGGYNEDHVRHWLETGEDRHWTAQAVCGLRFAEFAFTRDHRAADALRDEFCRADLQTFADREGPARWVAQRTLDDGECILRTRIRHRNGADICMSYPYPSSQHNDCFKDKNSAFMAAMKACKLESPP